jgi:phosphate transport system permease protein
VAITTEALRAGRPDRPRSLAVSPARTARRVRVDRWAARLVALGGVLIIAAILAMLVVISAEVYPLFRPPAAEPLGVDAILSGAPVAGGAAGVDEYREHAYGVTESGVLELLPLRGRERPAALPVPGLGAARLTSSVDAGGGRHLFGTSDGRAIPLQMAFEVSFENGARTVTPRPAFGDPVAFDAERRRPIQRLATAARAAGAIAVAQVGPAELVVRSVVERKALIGPSRAEASLQTLTVDADGAVTTLALDARGEDLFLGTSRGQVLRYDLRDSNRPALAEAVPATDSAVTMLGFLIGDRTLVAGDARGQVSSWQVVPPPTGGAARLVRIYRFDPHAAAVVAFAPSPRDKGFVTADARGGIHVSNGTSGRTLLRLGAPDNLRALVFAPKADGLLAIGAGGQLAHWHLDNPHPEITLRTLFGKVWYEGYSTPAYVWQSTGGTDDFESKLSLTPLVYGTLKGTVYALLVAVPLSLLAALYVSEFMHPSLKGAIKPVIEIMAALPSVVLGFLAGLWLAPMVERVVPGLFLLPGVLAACILGAVLVWRRLPATVRRRTPAGTEALLLVPVALAAGWLAFALGDFLESGLLAGDYRGWLRSALGLTYDQRNSLVVGVAMGFAVIPIIFTIAEDSLANVPQHLRAGSLALGATRWQTALRIVLPTASPGIFSAIMIGFGRAVGETMIVLMATGNTPVMDWSIFSGFRALSANIAVELPEAPEGGTLFRVLFLAALLLFCLTFVVNTAAEVVRLRLRRRYRYL